MDQHFIWCRASWFARIFTWLSPFTVTPLRKKALPVSFRVNPMMHNLKRSLATLALSSNPYHWTWRWRPPGAERNILDKSWILNSTLHRMMIQDIRVSKLCLEWAILNNCSVNFNLKEKNYFWESVSSKVKASKRKAIIQPLCGDTKYNRSFPTPTSLFSCLQFHFWGVMGRWRKLKVCWESHKTDPLKRK